MKIKIFLMATGLTGVISVLAQQVISPIPSEPATPPAMQEYVTETTGMPAPPAISTPLRWGPVTLRPRVDYQFLSGSGIPVNPSNHVSSVVHEVAPGLILGLGNHWTVDYAPTWTYYSNRQLTNKFNQAVHLTGGTIYGDWVLGLAQSYVSSSEPLAQTGTQTEQEIYATALTASYSLNSSLRLDMALNQTLRFVEKFADSREWSTMDWLAYKVLDNFETAVGAGFGYVALEQTPDQTYEQLQGRVMWKPAPKFRLRVNGGAEFRQTPRTLINPIFGASVQYQPFHATTLSLSASRRVDTSYYQGQLNETTGVSLDLSQRFLQRFYVSVTGGYGTTDYVAARTGTTVGRKDTYYSLAARVSTSFWTHGTLAAFYQYSDNDSSDSAYAFRSQQVGCQIGFRY